MTASAMRRLHALGADPGLVGRLEHPLAPSGQAQVEVAGKADDGTAHPGDLVADGHRAPMGRDEPGDPVEVLGLGEDAGAPGRDLLGLRSRPCSVRMRPSSCSWAARSMSVTTSAPKPRSTAATAATSPARTPCPGSTAPSCSGSRDIARRVWS